MCYGKLDEGRGGEGKKTWTFFRCTDKIWVVLVAFHSVSYYTSLQTVLKCKLKELMEEHAYNTHMFSKTEKSSYLFLEYKNNVLLHKIKWKLCWHCC